jgi:glutamine synthetase
MHPTIRNRTNTHFHRLVSPMINKHLAAAQIAAAGISGIERTFPIPSKPSITTTTQICHGILLRDGSFM